MNINIIKICCLVGCMLFMTACNDDIPQTLQGEYIGFAAPPSQALFQRLGDGQPTPAGIQVNLIAPSKSSAVNFNYEILASSTAVEGTHYTKEGNSGSIPANSFTGELPINILPDNINPGEVYTLDLALTSADVELANSDPIAFNFTVTCPSEIAGMYNVTTTYSYHDFLPDFNPNTTTAEIVEISPGLYEIFDFSGGLYSEGPYVDAYGTEHLTAQFTDVCGEISWEGQSDYWGAMIPLPDGVNSVDSGTGVITISWLCEGYGESGVSIYTPQ